MRAIATHSNVHAEKIRPSVIAGTLSPSSAWASMVTAPA
jgi:hypothetical protein